MGLMDRVKAQATQLAQQAQETAREGKARLDQSQANKRADVLLRNLGALVYAEQTGRGAADSADQIAKLIAELSAHEAENGITLESQPPPWSPGASGTGTGAPGGTGPAPFADPGAGPVPPGSAAPTATFPDAGAPPTFPEPGAPPTFPEPGAPPTFPEPGAPTTAPGSPPGTGATFPEPGPDSTFPESAAETTFPDPEPGPNVPPQA
jgi:hypothetical protein